MITGYTPMKWPGAWRDPAALGLLKNTSIDFLLVEKGDGLGPIVDLAQKQGLRVAEAGTNLPGVTIAEGVWPGVKLNAAGAVDRASAGPTGAPWVDSNGWKVRLMAALKPETEVWINASPPNRRNSDEAYMVGIADAAAHGGRWIISLDSGLAEGIAARDPESLAIWQKMTGAAGFFAAHKQWSAYIPAAVIGVVSDFAGKNEFLSHEILNLLARTGQQYRIILKAAVSRSSFMGLRAVMYPDDERPSPELYKRILAFVEAGGMLVTGPNWGPPPGIPAKDSAHPRYELRTMGKGRVAVSKTDFEDPYLAANDSVVLISHRYELLRFWNAGAVGCYFTSDPGRSRAVVHLLFYAFLPGDNRPTVRVVGQFRTAKLWTLNQPTPRVVESKIQANALELYLPPVSGYAALELD